VESMVRVSICIAKNIYPGDTEARRKAKLWR
jgi:hypothetical protein